MDEFILSPAELLTQFTVPQCAKRASARQHEHSMQVKNTCNKRSTRAERGREIFYSSCCHWTLQVLPFSAVTGQARPLLLVLSATAWSVKTPTRVLASWLVPLWHVVLLHSLILHIGIGHQVNVTVAVSFKTDRYHTCQRQVACQFCFFGQGIHNHYHPNVQQKRGKCSSQSSKANPEQCKGGFKTTRTQMLWSTA